MIKVTFEYTDMDNPYSCSNTHTENFESIEAANKWASDNSIRRDRWHIISVSNV